MKLKVYRIPKHITLDEVEKASNFYASTLMTKRMLKNIKVRIVFLKTLRKKSMCFAKSYCDDSNHNPREFTIELDSLEPKEEILSSLAHEFVHIKQWAKGEFVQYFRPEHSKWMGIKVDLEQLDYYELPWEIEAHAQEQILYNRYLIEVQNVSGDN